MSKKNFDEKKNSIKNIYLTESSSESSSESLSSPRENLSLENLLEKLLKEDSNINSSNSNNQSTTNSFLENDKDFLCQDEDKEKDFKNLSPIYKVQDEESLESSSIKEIVEKIDEKKEKSTLLGRKRKSKSPDLDSDSSDEE